jgi:hypothetical protein
MKETFNYLFFTIFFMFVGAEVGEYFECPRIIFKATPISGAWSCCTSPR